MSILNLTEQNSEDKMNFKNIYDRLDYIEKTLSDTNDRLNKTTKLLSTLVNLSLRKVNGNNQLYLPEDVTHCMFQQLTMEKDAVNALYKLLSEIRSN
jgi:hypothetical protein